MGNYKIKDLEQVTDHPGKVRLALRDAGINGQDGMIMAIAGWRLKQVCPEIDVLDDCLVRI